MDFIPLESDISVVYCEMPKSKSMKRGRESSDEPIMLKVKRKRTSRPTKSRLSVTSKRIKKLLTIGNNVKPLASRKDKSSDNIIINLDSESDDDVKPVLTSTKDKTFILNGMVSKTISNHVQSRTAVVSPKKPRTPNLKNKLQSSENVAKKLRKIEFSSPDTFIRPTVTSISRNVDPLQGCASTSTQRSNLGNQVKGSIQMEWNEVEFLAEIQCVDIDVVHNVTRLLDEDNTIPFISRYRKHLTQNMAPEKLREVKATYEMLKNVKEKAATVMTSIAKVGKLTPVLEKSILCARSLNELEHLYTPFKAGAKHSKADKARKLGLEPVAVDLLEGRPYAAFSTLVQPENEGRSDVAEIELGIQHIIADIISKDKHVLDKVRQLKEENKICLSSAQSRASTGESNENIKAKKGKLPIKTKKPVKKLVGKVKKPVKEVQSSKFQLYFDFRASVRDIKSHQVLAINRGESLKVLTVKVDIDAQVQTQFEFFCYNRWIKPGEKDLVLDRILRKSIKDSYKRLVQPFIVRQVRSDLTQKAHREAVDVFIANLKKLLLSPPLRGKTVLGIDPGFTYGCKLALLSQSGQVLDTGVFFLAGAKHSRDDPYAKILKEMMFKYRCELIALGNGKGCRETEEYLSLLIQLRWFAPLDVTYTIVNENGASIYSCSPLAKTEFPDLDPNIVSAVSLARRVQNPLNELVKVDPKHLGVGMYQHDVPEKQLSTSLAEVVVECVSFVGVDINTASDTILRHVAGLNASRAKSIVEWRSLHGSFTNRNQLKEVKGIGEKSFEQCAGFVRVLAETSESSVDVKKAVVTAPSKAKKKAVSFEKNPLDRTWIHPESYSVATRFITFCNAELQDIGQTNFIQKIRTTIDQNGLNTLAAKFGIEESVLKLITDGLQELPGHDLRSQYQEPLFRRGLTSMEDLQVNTVLTGRVTNVTNFGSFVDIGVGRDGLIHISKQRNLKPQLGDRVEVRVLHVDAVRGRVNLDIVKVLCIV